jgi:hypothetical protein
MTGVRSKLTPVFYCPAKGCNAAGRAFNLRRKAGSRAERLPPSQFRTENRYAPFLDLL